MNQQKWTEEYFFPDEAGLHGDWGKSGTFIGLLVG